MGDGPTIPNWGHVLRGVAVAVVAPASEVTTNWRLLGATGRARGTKAPATGWCSTFPEAEVMGMIDRGNGVAAQHEVLIGTGIGIISAASAQDPRDVTSDGNGEGVEVGTMTGIDVGGTTGIGGTSVTSGSV